MHRILIVKTSSLGDVVHNLPVIADIKTHYSHVLIDWLVEENFADIPRLHPDVNQVITVAIRRWRKNLFCRQTWREIAQLKKQLQAQQYDCIIDTQGLLKSGLLVYLARGAKHGYHWQSAREPLASLFYQHRYTVAKNQHAVERNRQLVAQALGYVLENQVLTYGLNPKTATAIQLPARFIIALHSTSRDSKLWPTEYWIALGNALNKKNLPLVLPWGSSTEQMRAMHIANNTLNAIVLPQLDIAALANITSKAHIAIGVDTGLMHLAVALNIPSIAIYTDTNPALTGLFSSTKNVAYNLGGQNETPSVANVMKLIEMLTSTPSLLTLT